jgi:lipoyl(octanoyl) transferase
MPEGALRVIRLGRVPYADALELQRTIAHRRITGELSEDILLLIEHPPVVTLGRTARASNLTASPGYLRERGVELFEVERGGDITFHGPGQLVGYPIFDLKRHRQDLHWYLRQVEEALIRALATFGIAAWRNEGYTGVWVGGRPAGGAPASSGHAPRPPADGFAARVDDGAPTFSRPQRDVRDGIPRKIASIGVHARDWVTWHGFALNVTTDLSYFGLIVPCGIQGVVMTSIARELGAGDIEMGDVEQRVAHAFGELFSLTPVSATLPAPAPSAR